MFGGFIAFFFSSSSSDRASSSTCRESCIDSALRMSHSKRLIHANKRMLKHEAEIRAELTTHGGGRLRC